MDLSTDLYFPVSSAQAPPAAASLALIVRELNPADLEHGFLETLASLSAVGLRCEEAVSFLHERRAAGVRTYVACAGEEVVGTASLLIERKFLHRGGLVGHVEDVAVRRDVQRQGVGTALMLHIAEEARRLGCYKVILNCFENRVGFYERLGYHAHDCGLRLDC